MRSQQTINPILSTDSDGREHVSGFSVTVWEFPVCTVVDSDATAGGNPRTAGPPKPPPSAPNNGPTPQQQAELKKQRCDMIAATSEGLNIHAAANGAVAAGAEVVAAFSAEVSPPAAGAHGVAIVFGGVAAFDVLASATVHGYGFFAVGCR